ncbi:MAG: putative bifunctional diguanylate cyclase/phosphodiesterase [Gammaproteobacteria bacterium]
MMITGSPSQTLVGTAQLLKSRTNKYALLGVSIAALCLLVASFLAAYLASGHLTIEAVVEAQRTNFALWILDAMPFIFAIWGQYSGSIMAYEAGAVILDQTSDLRAQAAAAQQKITYEATHDALTGLPNRVLLHDRLQQAISAARREQDQLAVLIMDLDHFREINDTLGHYNGDLVLKQIASRLKSALRDPDTVARLGGDEFAVMLPKSHTDGARLAAHKLLKALEPSCVVGGLNLEVRASIGIALFPEHGTDADTLLQRADVAMYATKHAKTGYTFYTRTHDQYSPHRLVLMGELRQAIEQDDLVLHYQPKVRMRDRELTEVEALVRWRHPQHGLIPPDEFIPLAERTGLINPLTHWVLDEALRQCAEWTRSGRDIGVCANVSARVLLDPSLPDTFAGMLAAHQVPASRLVLEITESTIMTDQERALEILTRLHRLGIRLSIDDFGTGYSSLAYLKRLPVEELKIDRSFVQDMATDENDAVIVRATIDLAHNLGLRVIAEGVCNRRLWETLDGMGCDAAQGEYVGTPRSAADFIAGLPGSPWRLRGSARRA